MTLQSPRTSVFTFQSAVHSSHVLQCLNQQRQRDVLCDVTVVVENSSFRAHCSVLASCSDYFHTRIINHTRQSLVINLPDEVRVDGFEPLLQFAYTSKLLFTKENIHAIDRCARFLGFHNLESACFDFLIPRFLDSGRTTQVRRRDCCQSRSPSVSLDHIIDRDHIDRDRIDGAQAADAESQNAGQKTGSDRAQCSNVSPTEKPPESQSSVPLGENVQTDFPSQCPKNPQVVVNSGQEQFCLQNCGPQMPPSSDGLTSSGVCPILALPCPHDDKVESAQGFSDRDILEMGGVYNQSDISMVDCTLPCDLPSPDNMSKPNLVEVTNGELDQSVGALMVESVCNPGSCGTCPMNTSGVVDGAEFLEQTEAGLDRSVAVGLNDPTLSSLNYEEGYGERSSVEREVAEHLAKGFWPSQSEPLPLDSMDQPSLRKAAEFHWLKQLDLTSSTGDCPFLRDLGAGDAHTPGADSLSQSERSLDMSSVNSGEDSDLDTDGDTEANNKRALEVQLPFPVENISSLSRSAFQQLLRHQHLTPDQLDFVHDVRRRSKNRVAAQRCRKRKLDGIHKLQSEINTLRGEKEKLILERSQMKQSMEETLQSLTGLCQSVCREAGPEADQLQLLAKFSSSEFPMSVLLTPMSSPSLVGQYRDPSASVSMDTCPSEDTPTGETLTSTHFSDSEGPKPPQSNLETEEGPDDPQKFAPCSIVEVCLNLNSNI